MKILSNGKMIKLDYDDEIAICTNDLRVLFYIRVNGECMDILAAGDNGDTGDYGQLAITPLSSRRLTVRRDRRDQTNR